MNDIMIAPLFAQPVCIMNVDFVTEELIEYVSDLEYSLTKNEDGWITKEKNILYKKELVDLKRKIEEKFEIYKRDILQISDEFQICASWVIKHEKGHYSPTHIHQNSIFSGILYLRVNKESGTLIFSDMTSQKYSSSFSLTPTDWNFFNSPIWNFKPENNQLFFFPSSLHHTVSPSNSNEDRLVLAFNLFLKKFSSDENTSQLQFKLE